MSIGAEMNHKEPGFKLEDSKMGRNGLLAFVRLDFELRGFGASRLGLFSWFHLLGLLVTFLIRGLLPLMVIEEDVLVTGVGDVERLGTKLEELSKVGVRKLWGLGSFRRGVRVGLGVGFVGPVARDELVGKGVTWHRRAPIGEGV
ncbi:hypothetical protein Tco_0874303 [Tanacetum coccineum]|uniref:Uncharacterized protein n=1 Tax=Tanacetum coccineum TaxID=301880 RepID=A0ABQ5BP76_9ASTR